MDVVDRGLHREREKNRARSRYATADPRIRSNATPKTTSTESPIPQAIV
jgi:hypothetical protein